MSLYALKPRFQALLRPLVGALARAGITANQVTGAAVIVSIAVGSLAAWSLPDTRAMLLIPLWMAARMAFNAIDGMLAREFGQKSRLGAYLNELTDVIADVALAAPFALLAPFSSVWVGIVIVLAIISEYAGALGPLVGASRRYDGPLGKSDRALAFGLLGAWAGLASPLPSWAALIMPVLAVALVVTIINRIRGGLHESS
ncbi:MAG: CDP-alcohol phosphatidyltransferase family protein [Betaproteobacteria bacterium]